MQIDNENDTLISLRKLSSNDDYYNIVFKKTERISSAVFYILSYIEINDHTKVHYAYLSDKAMALHEAVIITLNLFEYEVKDKIFPLQHALVVMESALTIATAARVVTTDITESIRAEIDTVLRYIRHHYSHQDQMTSSSSSAVTPAIRTRRARPNIPKNDFSSDAVLIYSDLGDRTTRIKTVLEAKPEATIKDLSEIITDVSTKPIQRDLNGLIASGEVIRQGERRWSKYSISR